MFLSDGGATQTSRGPG